MQTKLLIGGQFAQAASGETFETYNPATAEVLASVARGGREDVDRAVEAARQALQRDWARVSPPSRTRALMKLASLMEEHLEELAELETRDSGKTISASRAEIRQAIGIWEFYAGAATKITGETLSAPYGFVSYTVREPVGVCAQIVPWNYPLLLTTWKLAPALTAGCTVVLKPASATPLTALRLGELILEAGIPGGTVNVVCGPGGDTGAYLVQHPGVDKVAFTGETVTGREIMRLASEGIKRLTLELGGKSPNIVFADADLEAAAASSVWAIFYNAGQSCEARSRLLVQREVYDRFLELFVQKTLQLKVGDPMDAGTHVGALISEEQVRRVEGYVRSGVSEGARLAAGGGRPDGLPGWYYLPTVLAEVENRQRVAQEEIFGPVVTATPFADEAEAVRLANDVIYGLAGNIWTGDLGRAHRMAAGVKAGVIMVNHPFSNFPGLPFGGYRQSGFGREVGLESLKEYTELKQVLLHIREKPANPWSL